MTRPGILRRRAFAIGIITGCALIVILLWRPRDSSTDLPRTGTTTSSDTEVWTDALASGRPVEFQSRDAAEETPKDMAIDGTKRVEVLTPNGRLSPEQKRQALETLQSMIMRREDEYRRANAEHPDDPLRILSAAMALAKFDAAKRMLEQDRAWSFTDGNETAKAWKHVPRGWEKIVIHNAARTETGSAVDLVFAMDPSEHPGIQSVREQLRAASDDRDLRLIESFNSKPLETRKMLIEKHDAARKALLSPELLDLPEGEYRRRRTALEKDLLRGRFRIDRQSYLLVR